MKRNKKKTKSKAKKSNKQLARQSAPVSIGTRLKQAGPRVYQGANGSVRVKHRELVTDIVGSIAWGVIDKAINPGLTTAFPWLSSVAQRYESYVFHGLKFLYETVKATNTDGVIQMTMDYDAADAAPVDKVAMMAHEGAVRSAPWQHAVFQAKQASLRKLKTHYVRDGPIELTEDIKTYDVGNLFVATQGMADASQVGELYVDYDVELITPSYGSEASANVILLAAPTQAPGAPNGRAHDGTVLYYYIYDSGPFGTVATLDEQGSPFSPYIEEVGWTIGPTNDYDFWTGPYLFYNGGTLYFKHGGEYRVTINGALRNAVATVSGWTTDISVLNGELVVVDSPNVSFANAGTTSGTTEIFAKMQAGGSISVVADTAYMSTDWWSCAGTANTPSPSAFATNTLIQSYPYSAAFSTTGSTGLVTLGMKRGQYKKPVGKPRPNSVHLTSGQAITRLDGKRTVTTSKHMEIVHTRFREKRDTKCIPGEDYTVVTRFK